MVASCRQIGCRKSALTALEKVRPTPSRLSLEAICPPDSGRSIAAGQPDVTNPLSNGKRAVARWRRGGQMQEKETPLQTLKR